MGINNLHKLLKKYAPKSYVNVNISKFAFEKIAIDVSLYLFKYKAIMGDRWLSAFVEMIATLRKNMIHPIFVYDNTPPKAKAKEIEQRQNAKNKMKEKLQILTEALEIYNETGEIQNCLIEFYNTRKKNEKVQMLLNRGSCGKNINMQFVTSEIEKMKSQIIKIDKNDILLTQELCDVLGVPWVLAKGEAEKECSEMCKSGDVKAVLSEDTDVLAYGCPIFLTKLSTRNGNGTCVEIELQRVLSQLKLDYFSFKDLCILCGCDYNTNIKGVGFVGAYKLIQDYYQIEDIKYKKGEGDCKACLNYEECRELFTTKKYHTRICYNSPPDINKLNEFCLKHNVRVNVERIKEYMTPIFSVE